MNLKKAIKERGMTMTFIENEANIPARTLSQFNAGSKGLSIDNRKSLKKVLKKYKINFVV
jgi:predicted transcriptional regulator